MAASQVWGTSGEQGCSPAARDVVTECWPPSERSTAGTAKAPRCGAFVQCAEEDSNLHPVSPDQALNLIRACRMRAVSFYAVDSVHAGEHIGRSGRSGCCHGCCRDKRPGSMPGGTSRRCGGEHWFENTCRRA